MAALEKVYEEWNNEAVGNTVPNQKPIPEKEPEKTDHEEVIKKDKPLDETQPEPQQQKQLLEKPWLFATLVGGIVKYVTLLISLVFFSYMTLHVIRYSYGFKSYDQEYLQAYLDSKVKNILVLLGVFIFFAIVARLVFLWKNQNSKGQYRILQVLLAIECFTFFVISVVWVHISHSLPYGDQIEVVNAAQGFVQGDFSALNTSGYLDYYPHQLSLVLIMELLFHVFGNGRYIVFQYLNACFMPLLVFSGFQLTNSLFQKKEISLYYLLLMAGFLQLFMYVPFVYGDVGAIAFMLLEAWMIVKFCQNNQMKYLVGGVAASLVSIMLRKNSLVFMISVIIVLLVHSLQQKKIRFLMGAFTLVLSYLVMNMTIIGSYELRSGTQVSGGVPTSAFIAMGLQDEWPGPGWYNNYNKEAYQESNFDSEMADEMSKANIYERLKSFQANPVGAYGFLKQKILTQWGEPSYGSFWLNHSFSQEPAEGSITYRVFEGEVHSRISRFMNRYQTVIYAFFVIGIIGMIFTRRKSYELILPIGIVGGVLFSLIWEAKSRYVLPYFAFMVIYAALGIYMMQQLLMKLVRRYFMTRPEMIEAARIDADHTLNDATLGGFDDRRKKDKPRRASIFRFRRK